jgi:hypothetical protein
MTPHPHGPARPTRRRRSQPATLLRLALPALLLSALAVPTFGGRMRVETPTTIDVMVLYTPGAAQRYAATGVDLRIDHLVNAANDVFARTRSAIELRVVHKEEVAYSDTVDSGTALRDFTYNRGLFADVESDRTTHGADMVVLMRPYLGDGNCGIAWVNGSGNGGDLTGWQRWAYSHVSIDCGDLTLPHELGHNMGLLHSRRQDGRGGILPHALGHGVDLKFGTVMAYSSAFGAPRLPIFSSPQLACADQLCGIEQGQPDSADARDVLRGIREQVAAYLPEPTN